MKRFNTGSGPRLSASGLLVILLIAYLISSVGLQDLFGRDLDMFETLGRQVDMRCTVHHVPGTHVVTWEPRALPPEVQQLAKYSC